MQSLLTDYLKTCNPWALERGQQLKTYLPELKNAKRPAVHFKQHHQVYDVPVYVVADCETYREGNSNAHVASFAFLRGWQRFVRSSLPLQDLPGRRG